MAEMTTAPGKMAQAMTWLADFLADKPRLASECLQKGKAAGHSEQAIRKAKNSLHAKETSAYTSFGRGASCVLLWQLPLDALKSYEQRQQRERERHARAVAQATERSKRL